jgi:hypothetical protein
VSAVFYQVIHRDPQPLRDRAPEAPAAVEAVLRRALSKSVSGRYPSIRDFAEALASAANARPDEAPLPAWALHALPGESSLSEVWVERRQGRRERRRADASDAEPGGVAWAPLWRKLKPIHTLSAAAIVALALVLLRGNEPAKAAPPPAPTAVAATSAASAVTTVPVPMSPPVPAAAPAPAKPAVRPAKHRTAGRAAPAPDAPDPFEPAPRLRKPSAATTGRARLDAEDSSDPFAPARPAARRRAGKADGEFADPFAP